MDDLVRECEKLWPSIPWTTSPLHGVPRETRKALLADLLYNKVVPPCYERYLTSAHTLASCNRALSLLRAARDEFEITKTALDDEPWWYLTWYKAPAYEMECCRHSYVLYDLLCSLSILGDINDALALSSGFYAHILVDHAIEMEGGIQSLGGGEDNIVNYLIRAAPESPPDIYKRLRTKGIHMRYSFLHKNVHPRTALWVHRHYGDLFDTKDVSIYMDELGVRAQPRSVAHLVLYAVCLNQKLSTYQVAHILGRVMPPYTPLTTALFDFIAVELESGRLTIDVDSFIINRDDGPCNQALRVMTADQSLGLSWLVNFLKDGYVSANSDVDVDYWVLYFWKMGLIENKYQALRISRGDVGVDMRIIDFCFRRTASTEVLTLAPETVIPFDKPFDLVLSNKAHKKLHVHLQRLKDTCSFFKSLDELKLFKPLGGLKKGEIDIHCLLGHCVQDLDRAMHALLHHIYTGRLPPNLTVDAVDELNTLAGYVGNDACAWDTTLWMWRRYLTRFEDHFECSCIVCLYWLQGKHHLSGQGSGQGSRCC
jgi:hypothetical protein